MSTQKLPGPLPDNLPDLVEYAIVRRIFKWKDNRQVRDAVKADKLVRVQTTDNTKGARITADSVRQLHADMIEMSETCKQFDITPGRMKAMRQAKKQRESSPVPQITVELDEREIIRQAHNLDKTPAPPPFVPTPAPVASPQSEAALYAAYHSARGAQKVAAYRALTFRQKNAIIESQRVPEPEFDLVAYRKRVAARES